MKTARSNEKERYTHYPRKALGHWGLLSKALWETNQLSLLGYALVDDIVSTIVYSVGIYAPNKINMGLSGASSLPRSCQAASSSTSIIAYGMSMRGSLMRTAVRRD